MSRIHNSDTILEKIVCGELVRNGITTFVCNDRNVPGKPDIAFPARKIAIFCDGDFWHGYDWETTKHNIKSNREFWISKIEQTMKRDRNVTQYLRDAGWSVLRFWGHEIKKELDYCMSIIFNTLRVMPTPPYKTIDLCAGIGGIRRGFELTGQFKNVLSAETDQYACETYQMLFGDNPYNDVTSNEFKIKVSAIDYDFLLAGFPCQAFSSVGRQEGFDNAEKGQIFFHIADIIRHTRPCGFFLENVERLVTHNRGKTFKTIVNLLVNKLGYYVIGINRVPDGTLEYAPKNFIRNSRNFGVPQNRPRTYLIGFDTERFNFSKLISLPKKLPISRKQPIYENLHAVLEHNVSPKYYMASGYWNTLIQHRKRQEECGHGFGYRIVNEPGIGHPIANTLLATGGSGRERNLVYDPQDGIAGLVIKGKKSPLNNQGIRAMTPTEWGKLQGFINYAFLDNQGNETFAFPENISDVQKYKQFGNAVTIPLIEEMAYFVLECLSHLTDKR